MKRRILGRNLKRDAGVVLGCVWLTLGVVPAYADCPVIKSDATLVVRVPNGSLTVDTSGTTTVEITLSSKGGQFQQTCTADTIQIEGANSTNFRDPVEWKFRVPKSFNLDLRTSAGSITVVGDASGTVALRTSGGSVNARNIGRDALLITQAGSIRVGNIGGSAEIRSDGGNLDIGDIGGSAFLLTASGGIKAGKVGGNVFAKSDGGSIKIEQSRGDKFEAQTKAGDISIARDARRVIARTEGGAITVGQARGDFRGQTDSGDIRVDSATASIDAISGFGDIYIRMDPGTLPSDFHINIQTGSGNITLYLPEMMRASIEATVDRVAAQAKQPISADFKMSSPAIAGMSSFREIPVNSQTAQRNGGGPPVKMRASVGTIQIRFNR
jgi:DUF4097 and DUF4098 domain-containing protein YvlB